MKARRRESYPATETGEGGEEIDFALIELFFFAYRDFTSDPDQILAGYGFGRAHHRVLHFVNRRPGLTVAELLDVLKITKQSLARVLKQLIDTGHIVQVQGPRDRRQRELYPTAKGQALALQLATPQSRRIGKALSGAPASERQAVERFLLAMTNSESGERGAGLGAAEGARERESAHE
jgi:DNA-binding MarR family transcriptional regulator